VLDRPAAAPDLVLRYGGHADAVIDVYLPPARGDEDPPQAPGPTPAPAVDSLGEGTDRFRWSAAPPAHLVVFVHGGFWRTRWDRVHARPLAVALRAAGFAVALPEYRRGSGRWEETTGDIETALTAVRRLIADRLPGHIDPGAPVTVVGHSAGGHLAMWGALRTGDRVVDRVVALAPVADLPYADRTAMGDDAVADWLGGHADQVPDAYRDADVSGLLGGPVPVTLIQGGADEQVPAQMNRLVAQRTGEAPASALRYVELPEVEHFALIDPDSTAWPVVLDAIRRRS